MRTALAQFPPVL